MKPLLESVDPKQSKLLRYLNHLKYKIPEVEGIEKGIEVKDG